MNSELHQYVGDSPRGIIATFLVVLAHPLIEEWPFLRDIVVLETTHCWRPYKMVLPIANLSV
jgi:hypothetical protein